MISYFSFLIKSTEAKGGKCDFIILKTFPKEISVISSFV